MLKEKRFYRVVSSIYRLRLPDPMMHGYETEDEFRDAVWRLAKHWRGREGEAVDERNDFLLIRFHDTPGGVSEEAWLPVYILTQIDNPEFDGDEPDSMSEIEDAFGFD